jgi:hypothetical protein
LKHFFSILVQEPFKRQRTFTPVSSTNKTHRHDINESGVQTCNRSFGSLIYKEHLSKLQEQCSQYDCKLKFPSEMISPPIMTDEDNVVGDPVI